MHIYFYEKLQVEREINIIHMINWQISVSMGEKDDE